MTLSFFDSIRILYPDFDTHPIFLAGFPTTKAFGGTSLVTTLPAPIIAHSPIVTPQIIVLPPPIDAPLLTRVYTHIQSDASFNLPSDVMDLGYLSLVKVMLGPTNTPSSIMTPP